jgi:YVTN family beta-propeller protein
MSAWSSMNMALRSVGRKFRALRMAVGEKRQRREPKTLDRRSPPLQTKGVPSSSDEGWRWKLAAAVMCAGMICLEAGGGAWGQGKTPKPALVVLNKDANELAIVDPATLKVVGRVATGPVPHEVAVSGDGKIAVVTNYGAHSDGTTLSVIDLVAQKEIHRVELKGLAGPHGVECFGGKAWFTAEGSKVIGRYDSATNKIDLTHEIGQNRTHMLVIARDGKTIYTSNVNSDSVTVVEASADGSQWTNRVIAVGKGPEAIDLSPDGKEVWVGNSGDGTVSIIDAGAKKVVATVNVGTKHSNRVKFTPDGKVALLSDLGSGDLVVMDVAARKEVKRLKLGSSTEGILIQPDGARAFVAVSGDNRVAVVDLKTLAVVGTIEMGKDPDGMAWAK